MMVVKYFFGSSWNGVNELLLFIYFFMATGFALATLKFI